MVSDTNEWTCQNFKRIVRCDIGRVRIWLRRNGFKLCCILVAALVGYAVSARTVELGLIGTGVVSSVRG